MRKEAKINLKIIFSAIVLLIVMVGVVNAWVITILNPPADSRLNNNNRSLILKAEITSRPAGGSLNLTNVTFFYNTTKIGTNSTPINLTIYTFIWDISKISNGTYILYANASNLTTTAD